MRREARHSGVGAAGFSLVELIVVLAVIGILTAISIPVVRMFSQNDLQRGVRELNSLLRGAKVYASTYNVNTAVIYQIAPFPVDDTILGQTVRVLSGATVVYQLPKDAGPSYAGLYVPTPEFGGDFRPFIPGYCVLLQKPPDSYDRPPSGLVYHVVEPPDPPEPNPNTNPFFYPVANGNPGVESLGLKPVRTYRGYIDPQLAVREAEFNAADNETYLGHVFDGKGGLVTEREEQRFRILFAPMPDEPREERVWRAPQRYRDGSTVPTDTLALDDESVRYWLEQAPTGMIEGNYMGYQGQEVTIYRSTGRIKTGSLQAP